MPHYSAMATFYRAVKFLVGLFLIRLSDNRLYFLSYFIVATHCTVINFHTNLRSMLRKEMCKSRICSHLFFCLCRQLLAELLVVGKSTFLFPAVLSFSQELQAFCSSLMSAVAFVGCPSTGFDVMSVKLGFSLSVPLIFSLLRCVVLISVAILLLGSDIFLVLSLVLLAVFSVTCFLS